MKRDVDDFLFEASRRLAASPLDHEQALAAVARLAIPRFADACTVHMLQPDGSIAQVVVEFEDAERSDLARVIDRQMPPTVDAARGPGRVIRTGFAEVSSDVWADGISPDRSEQATVLGLRSYVCAPISADGVVAGALTFFHTHSGRVFRGDDVPVAEELGRRAGHALEAARRFERERSAREGLMRLSALTAALAKPSLPIDAVARITIEGGRRVLGAKSGTFHLYRDDGSCVLVAHEGDEDATARRIALLAATPIISANDSVRRRETSWVEDDAQLGTGPGVVAPLVADDDPLGAVTFGFDSGRRFDETDRAFVEILALHASHALARANLLERERRYHERVKVLADAGELLSGTLDYDTTLENVARLAVPTLADFCFFDLIEEDGTTRRLVGSRESASVLTELHYLERSYAFNTSLEPSVNPLWSRKTGFHPNVDDAWMQRVSPDPTYLALLRKLRLSSLITAPLVSARERLGSLTVCYGDSGRRHTQSDIALVEELARRAAVALKNARLYRLSQEATRRAEEAARQAEDASRLKDEFLATVSHELRTPLSAILGWATLLRGPRADTAFVGKGLEVIERNARSQQRLIEDILDVSRIVTGKLRIDTGPVDLVALSSDVLESVRPTAYAKDIELVFEASQSPCRLAGDSVRLRQVLWNLLSNAVKFTPSGGKVWLEIDQSGDRIVLRVRDTGRGIERNFLPHVFERFRQADSSTTREHGGLGLGLSIVRHLTEMHGGSVDVKSGGPDAGATFTVTLPVRPFSAPIARTTARDTFEAPPSSPFGPRRERLEGLRVVVVEDEVDSRDLIALLLASEGAVVQTTAAAEQAVDVVREFAPDVVLSDIGMPGHDGYWLAGELRRLFPHVPAIALTAYSAREDIARAITAGFDHHVAKPVDPEQLVHALTTCGKRPSEARPDLKSAATHDHLLEELDRDIA